MRPTSAARPRAIAARAAAPSPSSSSSSPSKPRVAVVGGGWAGFGAAHHLTKQGWAVTLLDAAGDPGGSAAGWRTKGKGEGGGGENREKEGRTGEKTGRGEKRGG